MWIFILGATVHLLEHVNLVIYQRLNGYIVSVRLILILGMMLHSVNHVRMPNGHISVAQWLDSLGGISMSNLQLTVASTSDEQLNSWLQSIITV
jgi:hypothetical protein